MNKSGKEVWYRLRDGICYETGEQPILIEECSVHHHTKCGVQLDMGLKFDDGGQIVRKLRFVAYPNKYRPTKCKRFAWPSMELAMESYRRRKEIEVRLLTERLKKASRILSALEKGQHREAWPGMIVLTDGRANEFSYDLW